MMDAIKGLFASRKFLAALGSLVITMLAHFGLHVPESIILGGLGLAATYIAGTAYEDGKKKSAGVASGSSSESAGAK